MLSQLDVEAHQRTYKVISSYAQPKPVRLSRREIEALALRCAPTTPVNIIASIVEAESGGHAFALLQNGPVAHRFTPASADAALKQLVALQDENASVDVGLMQINTSTLSRLHVPAAAALDSCTNIRLGAQVFDAAYALAFARRSATLPLLSAYSAYNTGDLQHGVSNGYADHALGHLRASIRPAAAG